jgi:AraC-like DNA-binding protein
LSVMGAGLFWAFARDLFEDTPSDWRRFLPALLLLGVGLAGKSGPDSETAGIWLVHNLIGAGLVVHILVLIAAGWRGDLVEQRRRLRAAVLFIGAGYALAVSVIQTGEIFLGSAESLSPLAAGALLVMGLLSVWAFGRVDRTLFAAPEPPKPADAGVAPIEGPDAAIAAELERLMRVERFYREEGLTIASLALRLCVPEHRLRQLINQKLGYRNFNAFLNQWRLVDAKTALGDPSQREVPISTIALDSGFASLGPFNRAFKAETALTPSEFRAQALAAQARNASGAKAPAT